MKLQEIPRRLLRMLLKHLAQAVLHKHQPQIIALIGSGETAVVREVLYAILHEQLPTRRNLEAPEAEFVIPLTIFGTDFYPQHSYDWLKVIAKTAVQLLTVKKHFHILILEMTTPNEAILDYWLEITRPKVVIACGNYPMSRLVDDANVIALPARHEPLQGTEDLPTTYRDLALKVGATFGIDEQAVNRALDKVPAPEPRLRLTPRRGGGLLLDATYEYRPPALKAIEEVLDGLPGGKIWIRSLKDYQPHRDDPEATVIVLGPRKDLLEIVEQLSPNPLLDN